MLTIKIKTLEISVSVFILPIVIAVIVFNSLHQYLLTLMMISLHETGHMIAAVISGAEVRSVRILPVGLNIRIDVLECSSLRKVLIYLAGPLTNLVLAGLCICLLTVLKDVYLLKSAVFINLGLACFNLLPVHPLDGSTILTELLTARLGVYTTGRKMIILSYISVAIILGVGILYFKNSVYTISWIVVGIYLLFCTSGTKRETELTNMKNLFFKRSRIIKYGIIPVRQIAVMGETSISKVLRAMDRTGYFHIVYVLDKDLRVKKVLTEQEILELFTDNGPEATFDKLLTIPDR